MALGLLGACVTAHAQTDEAGQTTRYRVARIDIAYLNRHRDHIPEQQLRELPLRLGKQTNPEQYVGAAQRDGVWYAEDGAPVVEITLAGTAGAPPTFYTLNALNSICQQLVSHINRGEFIGVAVAPDPGQIDQDTGEDKRQGIANLLLYVLTGEVKQVRSLADGERIDRDQRLNNELHKPIRDHSPLQPGDLMRKDLVEDYLFRLSRHSGRRVDVAISAWSPGRGAGEGSADGAAERPGVVVDYLVAENKPLLLYAQISNTGTEQTDRLRQRFGLMHNQLTGNDDVLSLDYITASFENAHAVLGSYERPLSTLSPHRWKAFGSWSRYTASDVGFAGEEFTGESWSGGLEFIANLLQRRELFLDLVIGARYENIQVEGLVVDGDVDLFTPSIGLRLDRITPISTTLANLTFEYTPTGVTDADEGDLTRLGRTLPDEDWMVLRWDVSQTAFLEPLLSPRSWGDPTATGSKMAHEIAASFRGQYAFDNRLIPQAQQVVGGLYTVRGYPESVVAGDTVLIGSAEYRLHVPRLFVGPEAEDSPNRYAPGHLFGKEFGLFGSQFRYVPQHPYGTADWDLVLKAFIDGGRAITSERLFFETDNSLVGAGVGLEFLYKRNLNLRVDWGFVLKEIEDRDVNEGSNRVHFVATFLY